MPAAVSLHDLACLALRGVVEDTNCQECAGIVATLGWAQGMLRGPSTGWESGRHDPDVARAEMWAAGATRADRGTPDLRQVCDVLDVSYTPAMTLTPGYAWGVVGCVRWLTGDDTLSPLPLPVRETSGASAGEVRSYAYLLTEHDRTHHHAPGRIERAQLRAEATRLARDSVQLDELVADTVRRMRDAV